MGLIRKVDALNNRQVVITRNATNTGFILPKIGMSGMYNWWAKRDDDARRFFWYIVVIIVAYMAVYVAPEGKGVIYRGAIALIGVHIIWTFLSSGKISTLTWTVVFGMLTYFVLAWGYPNDMPKIFDASWGLSKKVVADVANKATRLNDNYGKETNVTEVPPQQRFSAPAYQPQTRVIEIETVEDRYKPAVIPPGVRFNIECPSGGIARYYHRGAPEGVEYPCPLPPNLGDRLRDFHIGFSKDTEDPVIVRVMITPLR